MVIEFFSWLGLTTATHALENALDAGADRLATARLTTELTKVFREWAQPFTQSGLADALLNELFTSVYKEPGPARVELKETISRNELPLPDLWFRALYERWSEVRSSGVEVQSFFILDREVAVDALRDLAGRVDRVCQADAVLFRVTVVNMLRSIAETQNAQQHQPLRLSTRDIISKLYESSAPLLQYPSTLTKREHFIQRPELAALVDKIATSSSSATVLIGERGAGKSSLLSRVAHVAVERGWAILAVKADMLPASMTAESLAASIGAGAPVAEVLRTVAGENRVVVLIDQIDAIAEIADRKTDRLNVLLDLVYRISSLENVHVLLSSREFEYRTDSRLTALQFESVRLDLPPFEAVIPILAEACHDPSTMGDVLRELLQNPLALKIFLDVARPQEHFTSQGALLERFWSMHVTSASCAADRVRLLERIAEHMTKEEHLGVPSAIADDLPDALQGLLTSEVLIAHGASLAFHHQAFYEFTIARRFGSGRSDLVSHVMERQDGLFVRPVLLTALVLLRETSPREYERIIGKLLIDGTVRQHVKALLIDFLGSQREPLTCEIGLLLPLLDHPTLAPRTLIATGGSPGWFVVLQHDERFLKWLKDHDRAAYCLSLLIPAIQTQREAVLLLIAAHWLDDAAFDNLIAQAIRQLDSIDEPAVKMSEIIVRRSSSVDWLVEHIAAIDPRYGARLVGADLDRRFYEALNALRDISEPIAIRRVLEGVLETDDRHEFLTELAKNAPHEFLIASWSRFVRIIDLISPAGRGTSTSYRHSWTLEIDKGPVPEAAFLTAARIAIHQLALSSPEAFLQFLQENVDTELSTIHGLLTAGLRVIGEERPDIVLEYLWADSRRFALGPENERYRLTADLITVIHPRLNAEGRARLETAIASFEIHSAKPGDDSEKRRAIARWNRAHRFALLRALDTRCVPPQLRRFIMAESRILGDLPPRHGVKSYWVGSRMNQEEILKASNADLLNLMNQLTDEFPGRGISRTVIPERSGGAEQLAHEINNALRHSPGRALQLLEQLDASKHQSYAPDLMEAFIKAGGEFEALERLLVHLGKKGFCSDRFRKTVGWALYERGQTAGLPDFLTQTMEQWLEEMEPAADTEDHHIERDDRRQPILAGYHVGSAWSSRAQVFAGFSAGLLRRATPDVSRWLNRVRHEIDREQSLSFWDLVIGQMAPCFNQDRPASNSLLREIIAAHPAILDRPFALVPLGRYAPALDPSNLREWLSRMRSSSRVAQQAWGELFLLQKEIGEDEVNAIRETLSSDQIDAIHGLCYGSTYVWEVPARSGLAAEILSAAVRRFGVEVAGPITRVLRTLEDNKPLDRNTENLIETILSSAALVSQIPTQLVAVIEPHATSSPALAYHATKTLIDVADEKLSNPGEVFSAHAGDLTTLALTLHRLPEYRARGLELFEQLIARNVYDAEAALEILDRRAARRYTPRPRRRLRRRQREHQPST